MGSQVKAAGHRRATMSTRQGTNLTARCVSHLLLRNLGQILCVVNRHLHGVRANMAAIMA